MPDTSVFTISNILSVIALAGAAGLGALMKTLMNRAFKATDDKIKSVKDDLSRIEKDRDALATMLHSLVESNVQINHAIAAAKNLDGFRLEMIEKFILRGDFIRELSLITNQIDAIYPKIEQLDNRIESLREKLSVLEKETPR